MTFRIVGVSFETREESTWLGRVVFDIKGIEGRGEYGTVVRYARRAVPCAPHNRRVGAADADFPYS